jgi:hypothetical protein
MYYLRTFQSIQRAEKISVAAVQKEAGDDNKYEECLSCQ